MGIFISYRRALGSVAAEYLYRNLSSDYAVFLDLQSLGRGRFDTAIEEQIRNCSDFLLVVTEDLFVRSGDPEDWIRKEIGLALEEGKNIIPVFISRNSFPKCEVGELSAVRRYNGIRFDESEDFLAKLKSFLVSNRRYILDFVFEEGRLTPSPKAKEELWELFLRFQEKGFGEVEIKLDLNDLAPLVEATLDYLKTRPKEFLPSAEYLSSYAKQAVLHSLSKFKDVLESSFSLLLSDPNLKGYASLFSFLLAKGRKQSELYYYDKTGLVREKTLYFYWIALLEELMKEIVYPEGRKQTYANSSGFIGLDGYDAKAKWYFSTYLPFKEDSPEPGHEHFYECAYIPGYTFYLTEIPTEGAGFYIIPQFYFELAMMKVYRKADYEKVYPNGVPDLSNFTFGLH